MSATLLPAPEVMSKRASSSAIERWVTRGAWWVAVFAIVCFANGLNGTFVLDDVPNIIENTSIRKLFCLEVWNPPPEAYSLTGRPFANFVFAIDYALFGLQRRGYHVGNLICHILAGWTLLGCLRRTFALSTMPLRVRGMGDRLALIIALIWGIHPLQTSAVTYISQRIESLASLAILLTVYCFIRGTVPDEESTRRGDMARRTFWHALAVVSCLLGVMAKEIAVTAPLLVLLYDGLLIPGGAASVRRNWRTHLALFATWIPLAALIAGTHGRTGTVGLTGQITPGTYFLSQLYYVSTYLKLCFWPSPLIFDYGWQVLSDARAAILPGLLLGTLLAGVLCSLRQRRGLGFLGLAFFVLLAPTSSFVPILTQTAAEHRMYLASAVVISVTVLAASELWTMLFCPASGSGPATRDLARVVPWLVCAVVLLSFAALTVRRNLDYRSPEILWQDTINKRPGNPRARMALAYLYQLDGRYNEAIDLCHSAIEIDPDFVNARMCLLRTYFAARRETDAEQDPVLRPVFFQLYLNEARRLGEAGRLTEAREQLQRARTLNFDPVEVDQVERLLQTAAAKFPGGEASVRTPRLE